MTQQFAYTGPSPKQGYVGFVNISETEHGVMFLVRSEGNNPPTASYGIPKNEAAKLLAEALNGIFGAPDEFRKAARDEVAFLKSLLPVASATGEGK